MEPQPIQIRSVPVCHIAHDDALVSIQENEPPRYILESLDLQSDSKLLIALSPADRCRHGDPRVAKVLASAIDDDRKLPPIPAHLQVLLIKWLQQPMIISWTGNGKFASLSYTIEITLKELLELEKVPALFFGSSFHKLVLSDREYLTTFLLEQGLTFDECEALLNDLLREPITSNPHDFDIKRFRRSISEEPSKILVNRLCTKLPPRFRHIADDDHLVIEFLESCNRGRPLTKNENQSWSKFLLRETAFDKNGPCFDSFKGSFFVTRPRTDVTPECIKDSWPSGQRPPEILDIGSVNNHQLFEHDLTLPLDSLLKGRVNENLRPEGKGGRKGLVSLLLRYRHMASGVVTHYAEWQRVLLSTTFGCRNLSQPEIDQLNKKALSQDIPSLIYDTVYRSLEGDLSASSALMINAYTLLKNTLSPDELNIILINTIRRLLNPPAHKGVTPPQITLHDLIEQQPPELRVFIQAIATEAFTPTEVISTLQAASYVLLNSNSAHTSLLECGDHWCMILSAGNYKILLPCKPIDAAKQVPHNLCSDASIDASCYNTLHKLLLREGLNHNHLIKLYESTAGDHLKFSLLLLALQLDPEAYLLNEDRLLELPACSEVVNRLEIALPLTRYKDLLTIHKNGSSSLAPPRAMLSQQDVDREGAWQRAWIRTFLDCPNERQKLVGTKLWRECYQKNPQWDSFSDEIIKSLASKNFWVAVSCLQFINRRSGIPFEQFAQFCQLIPDRLSEYDLIAVESLQKIALGYQNVSVSKGRRKKLSSHLLRLVANPAYQAVTTLQVLHRLLENKVLSNTHEVSDLWCQAIHETISISLSDTLQAWKTAKPYGMAKKENLSPFCNALIEWLNKNPPSKEDISALYQFLNNNVIEERHREAITPFIADHLKQFIDLDDIDIAKGTLQKMGPCALRAHVKEAIAKWRQSGKQIAAINLAQDYLQLVSHSPDLSLFQDVIREAVSGEIFDPMVFENAMTLIRSQVAQDVFKDSPINLIRCLAPWLSHTSSMSLQDRQALVDSLLTAWADGQASPATQIALAIGNEVMQLSPWTDSIHSHMRIIGPTIGNVLVAAGYWEEADRLAQMTTESDAEAIRFLATVARHQLQTVSGKAAYDAVSQASVRLNMPVSPILNGAPGFAIHLAFQLHREGYLSDALLCLQDAEDPEDLKKTIAKMIHSDALADCYTRVAYESLAYCNMPSAELMECHRQVFTLALSQNSFSLVGKLLQEHKESFCSQDLEEDYPSQAIIKLAQWHTPDWTLSLDLLQAYPNLPEQTWTSFFSQLKGSKVPVANTIEILEGASNLSEEARIHCWVKLVTLLPNAPELVVPYLSDLPLHIFPTFETHSGEQAFFFAKIFEAATKYCALVETSQVDDIALQCQELRKRISPLLSQPQAINYNVMITLSLAQMMGLSGSNEIYLQGLHLAKKSLHTINEFKRIDDPQDAWHYYRMAYFPDYEILACPDPQSLQVIRQIFEDHFTHERLVDICDNIGLSSSERNTITSEEQSIHLGIWDELIDMLSNKQNVITDARPLLVLANHLSSSGFEFHYTETINMLQDAIESCEKNGIDEDPDLAEILEDVTTSLLKGAAQASGGKHLDQVGRILILKSTQEICGRVEYAEVVDSYHACKLWRVKSNPLHEMRPVFNQLVKSIDLVLANVPATKSKSVSVAFSIILNLSESEKTRPLSEELLAAFFNRAPRHFYRDLDEVDAAQNISVDVSLSMEWLMRKLKWAGGRDFKILESRRDTCASTLLQVINKLPSLPQEAAPQIKDAFHFYLESCLIRPLLGDVNKDFKPISLYKRALNMKLLDVNDPDYRLYHFLAYQKIPKEWSSDTQVDLYYKAIDHVLQWKGRERMSLALKWFKQVLPLRSAVQADSFLPMLESLIAGLPDGTFATHETSSALKEIYEAIHLLDLPLEQKTKYHDQYVSLLMNAWTTLAAKECRIQGSMRIIGDFIPLTILESTVRTVLTLGINKKCYAGRMNQAIDDMVAFMPIIRMTNGSRTADNQFMMKVMTHLGKTPELHRHRAVAMNEWIRLMADLNIDDAKEYLLAALKQGWYLDHSDLLRKANSYLQPKLADK
ncbi:MAG: hypothetical protein Q8K75_05505 [Chlamydiales bacterium]|nr:hypothetical protein [Chlamydiales bacterium]